MKKIEEIPLFPLHAVLFPGGLLPLRIFEARYLDMIGECMSRHRGFGICAIQSGAEVGRAASCYPVGTLAYVQDFDRTEDGMLYILAHGRRRFRIVGMRVESSQLLRAEVQWLDDADRVVLPADYRPLAAFLSQLIRQAGKPFSDMPADYDDADWVAGRLVELLPFALEDKQRLLEMDKPIGRLEALYRDLLAEEISRR